MKTVAIILAILGHISIEVKSKNSNLDTVYLQDKKAWHFYADYHMLINESRRNNLTILTENDPKHKEAFQLIDKIINSNTDAQSIVKPLLNIGVKSELMARYKLHFYQQMTGAYYSPYGDNNVRSRVPDNIMYVVDRKTNMLKFMKCWNFDLQFDDEPEDIAQNRQTIGEDVFSIAQINMKQFERYGYKRK
jgi:hypothetical protein